MLQALSPRRSLSTKLILFTLLILGVSMVVLTLINNSIASENLLDTAHGRITAQAQSGVEHIELYMDERRGDISFFATLLTVRRMLEDQADETIRQEMADRLITARDTYGYDAISVLDDDGTVIFSTSPHLEGQQRGGTSEVQAALNGRTTLSQVGTDPDSNTVFYHVAAPVVNEQNEIIGVVDGRSTLDEIESIVGADTDSSGAGSYSVLLDEHLIRIAIPSDPDNLFVPETKLPPEEAREMIDAQRFGPETASRFSAANDITNVDEYIDDVDDSEQGYVIFSGNSGSTGLPTEAVLFNVNNTPWYYLHRVPHESFYSAINAQTTSALWVTLGAGLVGAVAMIVFARQSISRPLNRLVDAARSMENGDLSRRLETGRQDEIGQLASSFNAMAGSLENRISAEQQAREEARQSQEAERANRAELERTVEHYLAFLQHISSGDLSRRLDVQGNGALGMLGNGLNSMVENLYGITAQVREASSNIAAAAAEILAATTQQASSSAQQSSAVTQTTTTVEEVKQIARQTAQQAEQVAHDSQEALEIARQGTQSVEETVSSMEQIRSRVEGIAQTILSLSEQTQAIGAITTTVSELADQSNLLALNAAIEAARAGEQGRSFAVVAQNVRDLAERSKAATGQVRAILEEIQRATHAAVLVTEEGSKGVEAGTLRASSAGQMIHRIATEVEGGAQSNTQMAAAAHQQTAGMEQIGQAMISIQQATTQALSSTQQAERAARDLNELSQSLQQAISTYRL